MALSSATGEHQETGRRSPEHWLVLLGAFLLVAGLAGMAILLEPDERGYGTHEKLGLQPCMPMKLWGFPCPGCGVTTSVTHAAQGELVSSLRVQPFGLLLVLGALAFPVWALTTHLRGRDLWRELSGLTYGRWASVAGVLLAVCWIYKLAATRGWFG